MGTCRTRGGRCIAHMGKAGATLAKLSDFKSQAWADGLLNLGKVHATLPIQD